MDATRELCDAAARGDELARDALLRMHLVGLRRFVDKRLGPGLRSRESSGDLVQSVMREALQDLDRFEYRGEGSFRRWLWQRAENKLRMKGRYWSRDKRTAEREHAGDELDAIQAAHAYAGAATPSRIAADREELARLEAAFAELSPDARQVILLARVEGLSHAEVAERMGRTPLATRSLLSRSLARLALLLEAPDEDPGTR